MRSAKTAEPRVLLIDRDSLKQRVRATVFRNCEIAVHTTESVSEALRLCKTQRYDMVLVARGENSDEASLICDELRRVAPRQRVALLVGPPAYLREMGAGREGARRRPTPPVPRLKIVEPQTTQWRILMDRLLAAG